MSLLGLACDGGQPPPAKAGAAKASEAPAAGGEAGKADADKAEAGKAEAAKAGEPAAGSADAVAADGAGTDPTAAPAADSAAAPAADTAAEVDAAAAEAGADTAAEPPEAKPEITDIRDPGLLPAGTPASNAEAFRRLPVAKGDKAPVSGAGETGLYLDELEVGRGWHKSRCDLVGNTFTVGVDDRVNICMRVIHPRGNNEVLVLKWARDGKVRQRSKLKVNEIHAYLTRGWLPITESRRGSWTVTIETEGGSELASLDFTIQ